MLLNTAVFSQKETANWYFGVYAGLHFQTGGPIAIPSVTLVINEGCSAISDSARNLFFIRMVSVLDKFHTVMPNGSGFLINTGSINFSLTRQQQFVLCFYAG